MHAAGSSSSPRPAPKPHLHVCTIDHVVYHLTVHPPSTRCVDTWVVVDGSRTLATIPCTDDGVLAWPAGLSAAFREHVDDALAAARRAWAG